MGLYLQLSDAQMEIMQIIWSRGGTMMFSELSQALSEKEKEWKTNTILTFLSRLTERGILTVRKKGRLNEYAALVTEAEYLEAQARNFVDTVYGGDAKDLVAALLKQKCLSQEDYEALKGYWEQGREQK